MRSLRPSCLRSLAAPLLVAGLVLAGGSAPAAAGETVLTDPPPDFDTPRRIILQLTTADEQAVHSILWNAINLQKFYGFDNVQIAIVAFGQGMDMLYRDSPVRARIESQIKFDIEYVACGNTMETTGHAPDDLIPGVDWVQAGIAEIVERQLDGWITIAP
ncbi:DsrE family protein [Roseospira visakhapatnamensis]|uniref:DsrE/DsrF-like family protein n=1 Tax=Roseospira visakhapatnamensis TaxID=390880 RepID=A0A7W6W8Z7_9PROT|nr:DsrE family protein [Roseospira visakhapatnamensis]MBB4265323.1 hypothetical protein [Roseospira visakhapatnamensis]